MNRVGVIDTDLYALKTNKGWYVINLVKDVTYKVDYPVINASVERWVTDNDEVSLNFMSHVIVQFNRLIRKQQTVCY